MINKLCQPYFKNSPCRRGGSDCCRRLDAECAVHSFYASLGYASPGKWAPISISPIATTNTSNMASAGWWPELELEFDRNFIMLPGLSCCL